MNYSFIIPHYNTPQLLKRLLDTIPSRSDSEIIIVDDNSSSTVVDFENFPGKNRDDVIIIYNKEGKGAGHARNMGMEVAKGKWLIFADSDDFFDKDLYSKLDRYIEAEDEMILFKASSVYSDSLRPSNRHEGLNSLIDKCMSGKRTAQRISLSIHSPWCRMVSRQFVVENKILFDEVPAANDVMFTTKVTCLSHSIKVSPEVLYVVTYREGSLWNSKKQSNNYLVRVDVAIRRKLYLKDHGVLTPPLFIFLIHHGFIDWRTNLEAFKKCIKKKVLFADFIPFVLNRYQSKK